jgi:hypothetical protein
MMAEQPLVRQMVKTARSHLRCALKQSCASDDEIIIGHVREAATLLDAALNGSANDGRGTE